MIVKIIDEESVHWGQVGWLLENKKEALPYHDRATIDYWEHFVFLSDGESSHTYGFNASEFEEIE